MKNLDFLSSFPSLYLLKVKRGKNKLGAFFSIIFVMSMLTISIYYIYIFFFGLEYNLIYYKDHWITYINDEQKEFIMKQRTFFFYIFDNPNNAKLTPILIDYNGVEIPAEKCKINPNPEYFTHDVYCLDLVFYDLNQKSKKGNHTLNLYCEENCTNQYGEPAELIIKMFTYNLKIEHSNVNPLEEPKKNKFIGYSMNTAIYNDSYISTQMTFTPIIYKSSKILNTKSKTYINTYLTSGEEITTKEKSKSFVGFSIKMSGDCDIYIRKYRTLLDTLSKLGGLFSSFKLLFELLIMFYSDFEINSEITKNVFSKIKNYENKQIQRISIEKNINNIDIKDPNENKIIRKKFKTNKYEQYFCSFFNYCCDSCYFCKTHRTMKIINLCSDFVQTYLSAENIIFNMLLFESYYSDNPIKFNKNSYINKIDNEIENENIYEDEEEKNKKLSESLTNDISII